MVTQTLRQSSATAAVAAYHQSSIVEAAAQVLTSALKSSSATFCITLYITLGGEK